MKKLLLSILLSLTAFTSYSQTTLLGDVNQDGHVNVVDIMVMVNYVLGNAVVEFEPWAGDVNYDEIVNVTDIMGVVRICLGM